MSNISTISTAYKGRVARFIRLCLHDQSIRSMISKTLDAPSLEQIEPFVHPSFHAVHTPTYLRTIAHAIITLAHENGTLGVFFQLGAIANTCNLQVVWDEDGILPLYTAEAELRHFIDGHLRDFHKVLASTEELVRQLHFSSSL